MPFLIFDHFLTVNEESTKIENYAKPNPSIQMNPGHLFRITEKLVELPAPGDFTVKLPKLAKKIQFRTKMAGCLIFILIILIIALFNVFSC